MRNKRKAKNQLIRELFELRQQVDDPASCGEIRFYPALVMMTNKIL
jgi:hypothetical protein